MKPSPVAVIIFGGAGDLKWCKLIPSFFTLHLNRDLPDKFAIIGVELAHLPHRKGRNYEDSRTGRTEAAREEEGRHHVKEVVNQLKIALLADSLVRGGGNARLLKKFPQDTRRGDNANAFEGGYRLWAKCYSRSISERFAH